MSLHAKITPLTKPMIRSPISHSWMYNVHIHLVRVQASHFSKCLNERAKPTQYVQHNLSQVCKVGSRRIQVRTSKLVSALTSIQNLAFSFVGYAAERMEFKSLVSEVLYRFKRCLKGQYELENVLISNRTITPLSRMVQMDVTGASNIPDILKELLKRIASASLHRSPMHLCRYDFDTKLICWIQCKRHKDLVRKIDGLLQRLTQSGLSKVPNCMLPHYEPICQPRGSKLRFPYIS